MTILRNRVVEGLASQTNSLEHALLSAQANPTTSDGPNWTLAGCCNTKQIVFISLICGYSVLIMLFWRWKILLPFKLITVFLHELGHATAAWMTCGKVVAMEVHGDEGGVTKTIGGSQWIILPAGYLGSAFWGCFFVLMSVDSITCQVAAGLLVLALFVVLYLADNNTLRFLCVGFLLVLAGAWACQILVPQVALLQYIVLFMGVMNGWFSIYDTWDDLISRRVNESDASKFAEMTHTSSRCWGVIWGLISTAFMAAGVYFGLVIASD